MLLRRRHVPQEEVFLSDRDDVVWVSATSVHLKEKARLQREILQKEVDLLRARVAIIRSQVGVVAKSGGVWVNAGARSQLGAYPWANFLALTASSYLVTRALRKLPFGAITAAAIPLATAALSRKLR